MRHARLGGNSGHFRPLALFGLLFALATSTVHAESDDTLVLGVRKDAPPFASWGDANDKPQGFSVALCDRIAQQALLEHLYCQVRYQAVNAEDRFNQLANGKVHLICGATTVTLARLRDADFSLHTFSSGSSLMFRVAAQEDAQADTPHQDEGKHKTAAEQIRVGALKGTTTQFEVERIMRDFDRQTSSGMSFNPIYVASHDEGVQRLLAGEFDVYLADREILLALARRENDARVEKNLAPLLAVSDRYFSTEHYALAIQPGNRALRDVANRVLNALYDLDRGEGETVFDLLRVHFRGSRFSPSLENMYRFEHLPEGMPTPGIPAPPRRKCELPSG